MFGGLVRYAVERDGRQNYEVASNNKVGMETAYVRIAEHSKPEDKITLDLRLPEEKRKILGRKYDSFDGTANGALEFLDRRIVGKRREVSKSLTDDQVQLLKDAVEEYCKRFAPLQGTLGGNGRFPATPSSDDKDVLIKMVDVAMLEKFREELIEKLADKGIPIVRNHGYTPHMTLAYVDPDYTGECTHPDTEDIVVDALTVAIGGERHVYPLNGDEVLKMEPTASQVHSDGPVTDRAHRYRAANAMDKPKSDGCALCKSKRNLRIDHKDGDETNDASSNLRWLCHACNIKTGLKRKADGTGRRVDKSNLEMEFGKNDCHVPSGPTGGQFCEGGGKGSGVTTSRLMDNYRGIGAVSFAPQGSKDAAMIEENKKVVDAVLDVVPESVSRGLRTLYVTGGGSFLGSATYIPKDPRPGYASDGIMLMDGFLGKSPSDKRMMLAHEFGHRAQLTTHPKVFKEFEQKNPASVDQLKTIFPDHWQSYLKDRPSAARSKRIAGEVFADSFSKHVLGVPQATPSLTSFWEGRKL